MSFRLHFSRWLVAAALVIISLFLLSLFAGVRIDGDPYRGLMNRWLTQQLGRSVHINGDVALILSLRPELIASDIRIDQPKQFGTQDFARLVTTHHKKQKFDCLLKAPKAFQHSHCLPRQSLQFFSEDSSLDHID